mmetsp:Transcript_40325/g.126128  ORF Transcript_40325/g.126128 Transcript_40325/m.126128 type:complete len:96 (-) Transcript_40325:160-447(-)
MPATPMQSHPYLARPLPLPALKMLLDDQMPEYSLDPALKHKPQELLDILSEGGEATVNLDALSGELLAIVGHHQEQPQLGYVEVYLERLMQEVKL